MNRQRGMETSVETQRRTKSDTEAADKGGEREREGRTRCTVEEREGQAGRGGRERQKTRVEVDICVKQSFITQTTS